MADCFYHTGRTAVTRCKQCSRPLCAECKHITEDGIFCSDKCAQEFSVFAKRLKEIESKRGEKSNKLGIFIRVILFLVIIYVLYRIAKGLGR